MTMGCFFRPVSIVFIQLHDMLQSFPICYSRKFTVEYSGIITCYTYQPNKRQQVITIDDSFSIPFNSNLQSFTTTFTHNLTLRHLENVWLFNDYQSINSDIIINPLSVTTPLLLVFSVYLSTIYNNIEGKLTEGKYTYASRINRLNDYCIIKRIKITCLVKALYCCFQMTSSGSEQIDWS